MGKARLYKNLRKAAKLSTEKLPDRALEVLEDRTHGPVAAVTNTFSSTRGLYRDMKREVKRL